MTRAARCVLLAIALVSLAGIAVSSVSLRQHYQDTGSSFCDFGGTFNCDLVNRSIYSTVFHVPVALVGVLGYLALLLLATVFRSKKNTPALLLAASVGGLGFALYLTYIEAFVLAVWCILCLSSLALISASALLSALLFLPRVRSA